MSIFNTAYDTSTGKGFMLQMQKSVQQMNHAIIKNNFTDVNRLIKNEDFGKLINPAPTVLTNLTIEEVAVEAFPYPIYLNTPVKGKLSESYVVFDSRPFLSGQQLDEAGQLKVRLRTEYDFYKLMTILTSFWIAGHYNDFRFLSKVPTGIYASLISESIARRFGLDPKDQLIISVLAAAFYLNLFNDSRVLTENSKLYLTSNLTQVTYAKSDQIFNILDTVNELHDLESLVVAIKTCTENIRLNDLNVGVLVSIISSAWFGTNGKAIISAALEHPPTWVSIVYTSFVERSFKNSGVSKVADKYRGNKGEIDFNRSIKNLVSKAKSGF